MNLFPVHHLSISNFLVEVECFSWTKTAYELKHFLVCVLSKLNYLVDVDSYQINSFDCNEFKGILELALVDKGLERMKIHGKNSILLRVAVP